MDESDFLKVLEMKIELHLDWEILEQEIWVSLFPRILIYYYLNQNFSRDFSNWNFLREKKKYNGIMHEIFFLHSLNDAFIRIF